MKKAWMIIALTLGAAALIYFFGVDHNVVRINKTFEGYSYMEDGSKASAPSRIELQGAYNKREKVFEGRMTLGDTVYENCMFTSGQSAISYDHEQRNVIGRVYFDEAMEQLSIQMPLPVRVTTGSKFQRIISAPADSPSEAADVYRTLTMDSAP
ncbi:hypothetical protein ACTHPF_01140 [Paenibacillus sp. SAF-054]|uniref:hypothetical protein n=1 Tax=unclassified Paenibacillus TaxID=185978 RepID=UPI003F80C96F